MAFMELSPMYGAPNSPSLEYGLDILPITEVAPFLTPSTLYPFLADPLFCISWERSNNVIWPPFPTYPVSAANERVQIMLQLPLPVRPISSRELLADDYFRRPVAVVMCASRSLVIASS